MVVGDKKAALEACVIEAVYGQDPLGLVCTRSPAAVACANIMSAFVNVQLCARRCCTAEAWLWPCQPWMAVATEGLARGVFLFLLASFA